MPLSCWLVCCVFLVLARNTGRHPSMMFFHNGSDGSVLNKLVFYPLVSSNHGVRRRGVGNARFDPALCGFAFLWVTFLVTTMLDGTTLLPLVESRASPQLRLTGVFVRDTTSIFNEAVMVTCRPSHHNIPWLGESPLFFNTFLKVDMHIEIETIVNLEISQNGTNRLHETIISNSSEPLTLWNLPHLHLSCYRYARS